MNTYFTFENLYKAYIDCRKRKGLSLYHMKFAENLEENLLLLERELQSRSYKPGCSIAFIVQKPKIREIFAADFRDRVVHHLLYNYLSLIFEKLFIYDSWACRKGKGTHRAMLRVQKFAGELERERERCRRARIIVRATEGSRELLVAIVLDLWPRTIKKWSQRIVFISKWTSKVFLPALTSGFCMI